MQPTALFTSYSYEFKLWYKLTRSYKNFEMVIIVDNIITKSNVRIDHNKENNNTAQTTSAAL